MLQPFRAFLVAAIGMLGAIGGEAPQQFDQGQILAAARSADLLYQNHFDSLAALLKSKDEEVRLDTISHLGYLQDPESLPLLLPFLQAANHSPAELKAAALALPDLGAEVAVPTLQALVKHPQADVRVTAMNVLTKLKSLQAKHYKDRSADVEDAIRASSLTNLGTMAQADAVAILAKAMAFDLRPHVRRMCAIGLGKIGDRTQGQNLADALTDPDPGVRRYAAEALVKLNYTPAVPALLMALEANQAGGHIVRCLNLLTGQDFGFDPNADLLQRTAAIEKGFQWWTLNAKDLSR
jgi:HEAT repeat protein